jgi:hypothetical protein
LFFVLTYPLLNTIRVVIVFVLQRQGLLFRVCCKKERNIMPNIGDVIEIIIDIPTRNLRAGTQGTIVHCHNEAAYEVELTNEEGETLDFLALTPEQFVVVWRA